MNCPFCQNENTKVLDSRPDTGGRAIRRRRECLACSKRWRTVERIADEMPMVIKKNGETQHYDKDKLLNSMKVACSKRPVSMQQIDQAIAEIEWAIIEGGNETISSIQIGENVMKCLRGLDEIAYVRFASVYRRFKDVTELMAEMKDLVEKQSAESAALSQIPLPADL